MRAVGPWPGAAIRRNWPRRATCLLLVVSACVIGATATSGPALANSCSTEQQKFVDDWTGGGQIDGRGTMARLYVYSDRWYGESCAMTDNTAHMELQYNWMDQVEAGMRQSGSSAFWYPYCAWGQYPTDYHYALGSGQLLWNQFVWVNATPNSGVTDYNWKCQWRQDGASSWTTFAYTGSLYGYWGLPQSEISRFGDADARSYATNLQYMGTDGWWHGWTGIHCSVDYTNDIYDYDAQVISATSWQSVHVAVSGSC